MKQKDFDIEKVMKENGYECSVSVITEIEPQQLITNEEYSYQKVIGKYERLRKKGFKPCGSKLKYYVYSKLEFQNNIIKILISLNNIHYKKYGEFLVDKNDYLELFENVKFNSTTDVLNYFIKETIPLLGYEVMKIIFSNCLLYDNSEFHKLVVNNLMRKDKFFTIEDINNNDITKIFVDNLKEYDLLKTSRKLSNDDIREIALLLKIVTKIMNVVTDKPINDIILDLLENDYNNFYKDVLKKFYSLSNSVYEYEDIMVSLFIILIRTELHNIINHRYIQLRNEIMGIRIDKQYSNFLIIKNYLENNNLNDIIKKEIRKQIQLDGPINSRDNNMKYKLFYALFIPNTNFKDSKNFLLMHNFINLVSNLSTNEIKNNKDLISNILLNIITQLNTSKKFSDEFILFNKTKYKLLSKIFLEFINKSNKIVIRKFVNCKKYIETNLNDLIDISEILRYHNIKKIVDKIEVNKNI